jgi:peptidoglycan-associated lipoprotein
VTISRTNAVLFALLLVAGCGGTRRQPAVLASPEAPAPSVAGSGQGSSDVQPVDEGPDVVPLGNEGAYGEEIGGESSGPLSDVHFAYDDASLDDEARATLDRHATWLAAHPGVHVTVEGHCDERGTVEYNLALGDRRAQAVLAYLQGQGVDAARLQAVSYGKEKPLDTGHDEGAFARNRRAHFTVSR